MGFLNTDSMPCLVEKLSDGDNIKITGNSKGSRVGTVIKKIVEKADDVTKAIEQEVVNDGYSFKVGTGNVDVSADVEDGFEEVGVKGVTYHNLISCDRSITVEGTREWMNLQVHSSLVKPNTVYTLFFDVESISKGDSNYPPNIQAFSNNSQIFTSSTNSFTFQTNSDTTFVTLRLLVNNATESTTVCKAIFKDIVLIEGNVLNNPNLPSYFEGIVGVGDKSKNLFNKSTITPNKTVNSSNGILNENDSASCSDFIPVDANTKYTISGRSASVGVYYTNDYSYIGSFSGQSLTTPSNCKNIRFNFLNSDNVDGIQLEKGTVATTYEPHHDGHKIEILSSGKNLFKATKSTKPIHNTSEVNIINSNSVEIVSVKNIWASACFILNCKPNTKYYFSCNAKKVFNEGGIYIRVCDKKTHTVIKELLNSGVIKNDSYLNESFTTPSELTNCYVGVQLYCSRDGGSNTNGGRWVYDNIILEEGNSTSYIPYQEDKTQILLDEPLMRLPNGVCDEITRDGKLIRRVGKVILNGSETWSNTGHGGHSTKNTFEIKLSYTGGLNGANNLCYCNRFPQGITSGVPEEGMYRVAYDGSVNKGIFLLFSPKISEIPYRDTNAWKQWLSKNPTTVYYELAEPIITELPAPYLRIFKDGHLTFNTLVAPESNHVVQLNKSAQIERSIREVQGLDSRVGQLESFYDDMMLETSHKLNLLTYDFEYTKESEDI